MRITSQDFSSTKRHRKWEGLTDVVRQALESTAKKAGCPHSLHICCYGAAQKTIDGPPIQVFEQMDYGLDCHVRVGQTTCGAILWTSDKAFASIAALAMHSDKVLLPLSMQIVAQTVDAMVEQIGALEAIPTRASALALILKLLPDMSLGIMSEPGTYYKKGERGSAYMELGKYSQRRYFMPKAECWDLLDETVLLGETGSCIAIKGVLLEALKVQQMRTEGFRILKTSHDEETQSITEDKAALKGKLAQANEEVARLEKLLAAAKERHNELAAEDQSLSRELQRLQVLLDDDAEVEALFEMFDEAGLHRITQLLELLDHYPTLEYSGDLREHVTRIFFETLPGGSLTG